MKFSPSGKVGSDALIAAFDLETGPRDFPKWAAQYYRLAAELSDKPFFKTMLDNFNKRWK
jgi:hypothetical protein